VRIEQHARGLREIGAGRAFEGVGEMGGALVVLLRDRRRLIDLDQGAIEQVVEHAGDLGLREEAGALNGTNARGPVDQIEDEGLVRRHRAWLRPGLSGHGGGDDAGLRLLIDVDELRGDAADMDLLSRFVGHERTGGPEDHGLAGGLVLLEDRCVCDEVDSGASVLFPVVDPTP
jgi:hypothetical protein